MWAALAHRLGQLQNVGPVRDWTAVAGVPHQGAGQEHGAQVVPVQNIHRQSGGGRAPLTGVGGPVLITGLQRGGETEEAFHLTFFSRLILQFPI